jgi:hypothetical protein
MPNWCDNEVWITGNADELSQLFKEASKPHKGYDNPEHPVKFLMDNIVPMPEGYIDDSRWYDWSIANWGTKWDLSQQYDDTRVYYTEGDSEGGLNYLTAWSPNRQFWLTASERFPSLTIDLRYIEEGMCYMGHDIIQAGEMLEQVYYNDIPIEAYTSTGATLNEDGEIDWDIDQEYSLWDFFPLIKEQELV